MNQLDNNYVAILSLLKDKIRHARSKAISVVNTQLLAIYWEIGKSIVEQRQVEGWGTKIIDRLSIDLKAEFPDMKGLSVRNIKYMRSFAEAYPSFINNGKQETPIVQGGLAQFPTSFDNLIVQAPLAQLSWYHHITLLDKVKSSMERFFYIAKTVENGWSRNVMLMQIESDLFSRQGKAITNFENVLPAVDSDLARETFKSPYVFDFLMLSEEAREKDLEKALVQHLKKFMLELGKGFAYVGNQYNLTLENEDYFLDLFFYNTHLHCYVIFELKIGEFKPEYAGKLNFYINTVNEQIKMPEDKPTIGVLLCKTTSETVVKYSLQGVETPMGIAEYTLATALPKELKGEIPTIEELEEELEKESERLEKPVDKKMSRLKELLKGLNHEAIKEKKSDEKTIEIFHLVLLRLYHEISDELRKEIIPFFDHFQSTIRIGNHSNKTIDGALEYLLKYPNEFDIGLEFSFLGFKRAGINTFNCNAQIRVYLHQFKYSISKSRNANGDLFEKLYHELPSDEEFSSIVNVLKEEILDDITSQIERIKLNKHFNDTL